MGPALNRQDASPQLQQPATPDAPPTIDAEPEAQVAAYLRALGVANAQSVQRITQTLASRVDPDVTDPTHRFEAMLEALDRWLAGLPDALGMSDRPAQVGFVTALDLGQWLDRFPEAIAQPQALLEKLRPVVQAWPHGVLPMLPEQEMHRQPLGELPGVLRGEFWSSTYRWALPGQERAIAASATADTATPEAS